MIKFSHTLFALPFALMGAVLAASGIPDGKTLFWILVAMVGARSAAMAFNRLVDKEYDKKNPRTSDRALAAGTLSGSWVKGFILVSLIVLFIATLNLNPLCVKLYPLIVAIILMYSYTKRFTWMCHFALGLAIGLAPICAWIAVRGDFDPRILFLGLAVMIWVAGFDLIYACCDVETDKETGLFSIPKLLGLKNSLNLAKVLHFITVSIFFYLAYLFNLGGVYIAGVSIVFALLVYEHSIVSSDDLQKTNIAFFHVNAIISILLFVSTLVDVQFLK